ncbi:FAD-dependent oxidoreductase [Lactobacillus sp. ESL0791]|uniref:FAD-dependent oxidoreductase n=1 Tax=Lactobacillus sp. ESL0791 TaxID=2983234 RepID=UPI0023F8EF69|nr:FAD-dependent oxidoreductase [Lactobacillus sp. ESL0791]MDF7639346.1 FAD-dependent oxidoreductase [Lactobacillus sp. ESL0791]
MHLKDGTYNDQADGHGGPIKVAVTVQNGKIFQVKIIAQSETNGIADSPLAQLPPKIVQQQTYDVDAISGASMTSAGIKNAVKKALVQAGAGVTAHAEKSVKQEKAAATRQITTDVAIIGAGPSGLAAAVTAGEHGLKAVVFEKNANVGGTGSMGMGPLGIDTQIQKDNFNDISVEEAFAEHMNYTHYRVNGALVKKYFAKSAETIKWLQNMGVKFAGAFPYFKGANATWHIVQPEDGSTPGPAAASWMNKRMYHQAEKLGAKFYLKTPAIGLVKTGERLTGLVAQSGNQTYEVSAKFVLVATGGFASNKEMLHDELGLNLNEDFFDFEVPGITGDGLKMMWQAGAKKDKASETVETIFSLPHNIRYFHSDAGLRQPNLLINQNGERFMNEAEMGNTTYTGNALMLQPGHYAYCIMDGQMLDEYMETGVDIVNIVSPGNPFGGIPDEIKRAAAEHYEGIIAANTLAELAEKLAIPTGKLTQVVTDYNKMCAAHQDPQFFKPAKYLRAISGKGGYIVGKFYLAAYATLGGIRTDENMRVFGKHNQIIPGLYCSGQDANTIYGDSYNFTLPGNSMGFAINSGRMAVEAMAEQK